MNNDLISRSELKKAIDKLFESGGYDSGLVMNTIDNAPTVAVNCKDCDGYEAGYSAGLKDAERPQGEWISVSERLPDKNGNYLCTVDYGENGVVVTQRNYWDTLGGFDKGYNKNAKVIAWQPLPEPYKEGGAE